MRTTTTTDRSTVGPVPRPHRSAWSRVLLLLTSTLLAILTTLLSSGVATASTPDGETVDRPCDVGVLCAWAETDYSGRVHRFDLRNTNMEECVPLPTGTKVRSFVNRLGRPVSVYQDAHCGTTGDFTTYPSGTYVPEGQFVVRAVQIWTH